MWKKLIPIILCLVLGGFFSSKHINAAGSLTLYTPYTGLSVTPGESISYNVDVINNGGSIQSVTFDVNDFPKDWDYTITADGKSIQQLSIRPNKEEQLTIEVTVPLKIDKGEYDFDLVANGNGGSSAELPFLVNVSEQGTFKTEFSTDQPNMEGHADSTFSYTANLQNKTAEKQHYALSTKAPKGWNVQFKADGKSVTSVTLKPSESKEISVEVTPAENAKANTYKIPVMASSGSTKGTIDLEAVISGTYGVKVTTPDGKLSADVTAGGDETVELVIANTGTTDLTEIKLKAETPPDWEAKFDKETIPKLKAGEKVTVDATITAPDDSIAGDYVTTFTAETPEVSSDATFRVSVETSTLWGIIGIAIIVVVIGVLYYIFRKFGRR